MILGGTDTKTRKEEDIANWLVSILLTTYILVPRQSYKQHQDSTSTGES